MDIVTGWVKPPTAITGLDHLAVQAPCISIYSQLLPGITNVTDRARYYSLYPWLIWSFEKRYPKGDTAKFESIFRRADCLLTLIAERHARVTEQDDEQHGAAMVGRNTLVGVVAALEKGSDKLSRFATREEVPTRYFKNRLGGLGQYYAGVLQDLGILAPRGGEWLKYTYERGEVIAKAVDAEVDGDAFFALLEKDRFTAADLDGLAEFCPCALKRSRAEYQLLLDLFFDRRHRYEAEGRQRALSLALILHLVDSLPADLDIDVEIFRAAVYTGCLPDGKPWRLPVPLASTRDGWRIYERNELFSIALQGLFTVALDALERADERFETTAAYAAWLARSQSIHEAIKGHATRSLKAAVERVAKALPELADWENDKHELALGSEVLSGYWTARKVDDPAAMYRAAFQLLLSLIGRDALRDAPYGALVFPPGFFEDYPLNLASLRSAARGEWAEKACQVLVELLCREWGLDAHLRVALRKLRFDTRATFRVRPTELGLEVVEVPPPVNTNPRFAQARQMLIDLGALRRRAKNGRLEVTELGRSLIGEVLGR